MDVGTNRRWSRGAGIAIGIGTQVFFAVCVWYLFWFLRDGKEPAGRHSLMRDLLLTGQFAVVHSLLLRPVVKARITRWIPSAFYGCLFCISTCVGLLLLISCWESSPVTLWSLKGSSAAAVRMGFYFSWAALFYSLNLTGLGYQTGLSQWWYWFRRRALPQRRFGPRGAYHWLRHPVYLSFLGLIWFTPRMTFDHAVLTGLWTGYIFLGSYWKDERLALYLGETYLAYQARVAGYPFVWFGPLGKRRIHSNRADVPTSERPAQRRAA
jgi:hypothetical protein